MKNNALLRVYQHIGIDNCRSRMKFHITTLNHHVCTVNHHITFRFSSSYAMTYFDVLANSYQ